MSTTSAPTRAPSATSVSATPPPIPLPTSPPASVVITGCDSLPILEQALQAARSFQPLSQAQVAELLAKTATVAEGGRYELYKTSHHFDGTYQNPQWLE